MRSPSMPEGRVVRLTFRGAGQAGEAGVVDAGQQRTGVLRGDTAWRRRQKRRVPGSHRCGAGAGQGEDRFPCAECCRGNALTVSAHKIYGPKGAAALVLDKRIELKPLISGGGQERNSAPGHGERGGIVSFGAACELATARWSRCRAAGGPARPAGAGPGAGDADIQPQCAAPAGTRHFSRSPASTARPWWRSWIAPASRWRAAPACSSVSPEPLARCWRWASRPAWRKAPARLARPRQYGRRCRALLQAVSTKRFETHGLAAAAPLEEGSFGVGRASSPTAADLVGLKPDLRNETIGEKYAGNFITSITSATTLVDPRVAEQMILAGRKIRQSRLACMPMAR